MAVNDVVLKHLKDARAELEDQVTQLNEAIRDLDLMIERYTETEAVTRRTIRRPVRLPSMRNAILDLMREQDREWHTHEIVDELGSRYDWSPASTRSLLVKLSADGTLNKVARGVYTLPADRPQDAEGPVPAGPSVQRGDDQASPPREGGGGPGGDREPGDHDDRPRADSHHRDHRLGAPVVGAPR